MEDLNDCLSFYENIKSFKVNLTEGTCKLVLTPFLLNQINNSLDRFDDENKGSDYLYSQEKGKLYELDTILKTAVNIKLAQRCAASYDNCIFLGRLKSVSRIEFNSIALDKVVELDAIANLGVLECIKCSNIPKLLDVRISDNLHSVSIKFSNLRSILPTDFESIKNLKHLDLSFNQLNNVIGLNTFVCLKFLNLSFNCLENVPILNDSCCRTLEDLRISNNNLTDLKGIERLINLGYLDLSDNCIYKKNVLMHLNPLHYLKSLYFINCPLSLQKFYRMYVVHFLDLNRPLKEFLLDDKPLSEVEKDFLGSFKPNKTNYSVLSSPSTSFPSAEEIINTEVKKSPKAKRKSKARDVVIMDSISPPLSSTLSGKRSVSKQNIVKNKSTPDDQMSEKMPINALLQENEDVISRRLMEVSLEDDFCEVKDSRIIASVHATEEDYVVKEDSSQIDEESEENMQAQDNNIPLNSDDHASPEIEESVSVNLNNESAMTPISVLTNLNNESTATPVSSSDESEFHSDDENLWPVKKIVDSKIIDMFLVLLDMEIKERSTISGRTIARYPIEFIQSCEKLSDSPITIKIQFMSLLKVKTSSVYIMEFPDSQHLLKKMSEVLSSRVYKSSSEDTGNSQIAEEMTQSSNSLDEVIEGKEPTSVSFVEGKLEETNSNSSKESIEVTNSSSVTSCVTAPKIGKHDGAPFSNLVNKYSEISSDCSEKLKSFDTLPRRESDIAIISEPSESSIEVIDEEKREEDPFVTNTENSETPSKQLSQSTSSESESLVTTYNYTGNSIGTNKINPISTEDTKNQEIQETITNSEAPLQSEHIKSDGEEVFNNFLTEEIKSPANIENEETFYSVDESSTPLNRSFENHSPNVMSDEVSGSEDDKTPQEPYMTDPSGDESQKTLANNETSFEDALDSSGETSSIPGQITNQESNDIVYNYTNYTEIDHRVKVFLYQYIFGEDSEQPLLFIRCHMWKTGGSDYTACVIFSTLKIYFFLEQQAVKGLDASDWLVLKESHNLKSVKQIFTLIWHQGLGIQLNNFSYFILLHNKMYCENLFTAIKGLSLKGCEMQAKPNSKLELNLQQVVLTSHLVNDVVDPTVIVYSICYDVFIIKDNDIDETMKLSGLVVTCGEFYLILGDLNWLCNVKDLPKIHLYQKMSCLIDLEVKGSRLDLHFLDEDEAVEEVWSLKCFNSGHMNSIIENIPNQFSPNDIL